MIKLVAKLVICTRGTVCFIFIGIFLFLLLQMCHEYLFGATSFKYEWSTMLILLIKLKREITREKII
jgi:hypothetical protein